MEKKNNNKTSGMKLAVLATVLVLGIIAVIVVVMNQQETPALETAQIDISSQPTLGESDAPVTVVEFGDFKFNRKLFDHAFLTIIENKRANLKAV